MILFAVAGCGNKAVQSDLPIHRLEEGGEKGTFTLENSSLKFELDASTTYFSVTDKDSGNVWYSNEPEIQNDTATGDAKNTLLSTVVIEYGNSVGGGARLNNYTYSISEQTYTIEQEEDLIRVNYTIGKPPAFRIIPMGISVSRLESFTTDEDVLANITPVYKLTDLSKISDEAERDTLIETWPGIEAEPFYILRDSAQEYRLADAEEAFEQVGYSMDDFYMDSIEVEQDDSSLYYNVSLEYTLDDGDLVVNVPFEKMAWLNEFPLRKLYLLPSLGAGNTDDEGYFIVPEGTGAIIEFNNGKTSQSSYTNLYYGWDEATKREQLIENKRALYNAFVIASNGSAVMCITEENEEIAQLNADISGKNSSYNMAYNIFTIVNSETISPSTLNSNSVLIYDTPSKEGNITQRYVFVDSDDYNDIALVYRDYLLETNSNLTENYNDTMPVYVDMLGAVKSTQQILGVPALLIEPLTTFNQADYILSQLKNGGLDNINVIYKGALSGGYDNDTVIDKAKVLSELGSEKGLTSLIANHTDMDFYLEADVQTAMGNNFSKIADVGRYVTRDYINASTYSMARFTIDLEKPQYYGLNPGAINESILTLGEKASDIGAAGISLRNVGKVLNTDYNVKNPVPRSQASTAQQDGMQSAMDMGNKVITNGGAVYTLNQSEAMLNIDLAGGNYNIIDEKIPFYTLAIHGLVDYSTVPINLSPDYQLSLLLSADNGAALYFSFMNESSMVLQTTNYTQFYGADFSGWGQRAVDIYARYNYEMGHTFGQKMVHHENVGNDISVTTYEDGTRVYVNYGSKDYTVNGVTIGARDYTVQKGG